MIANSCCIQLQAKMQPRLSASQKCASARWLTPKISNNLAVEFVGKKIVVSAAWRSPATFFIASRPAQAAGFEPLVKSSKLRNQNRKGSVVLFKVNEGLIVTTFWKDCIKNELAAGPMKL